MNKKISNIEQGMSNVEVEEWEGKSKVKREKGPKRREDRGRKTVDGQKNIEY